MDRITRRRRRLMIDYQDLTDANLRTHARHSNGVSRAISQCLISCRRQFLPHYFGAPPRWRVRLRQLVKDRALPDFCIIGTAKSGTSDLAVTIMSHPNVLHPLVKEFRSTDPLAWKPYYPTVRAVRHHARQHGVALCPLVSPYLHCFDIPLTLSALRQGTKVVINLRNPADLMFSMWKWLVLHTDKGLVERVPFLSTFSAYTEKALELFPELPYPFGPSLHYGIYSTSVAHWIRSFGEQNVRVYDVADYFKDRNAYLDRLEKFVGLPHAALPPQLPVVNSNPLSGLMRTPETSEMLRQFFEPYNRRLWGLIGSTFPW